MTHASRLGWYVVMVTALAVAGHQWQIQTFSLVPWPLFLGGLLPYLPWRSWRVALVLAVSGELVSSLPPGLITILVCLPMAASLWVRRPKPGLTPSFGLWVVGVTAGQWGLLALWAWVWQGYDVPSVLPWEWLATSLAVWLAAVGWHEAVEPYRRPRTQPRFKHA